MPNQPKFYEYYMIVWATDVCTHRWYTSMDGSISECRVKSSSINARFSSQLRRDTHHGEFARTSSRGVVVVVVTVIAARVGASSSSPPVVVATRPGWAHLTLTQLADEGVEKEKRKDEASLKASRSPPSYSLTHHLRLSLAAVSSTLLF